MTAHSATAALPTPGLRAMRIAAATAIAAGAALLLKVLLIVATGNTLAVPVETGLYVGGVLVPLFTAGAIAATRRGWLRRVAVWFGVVIAHLGYITMLSDGVGAAVGLFTDTVHLIDELPIALLGGIWVAVGLRLRIRAERF